MAAPKNLPELIDHIADLRSEIATHPLYDQLRSPHGVARFMEYHVFAVWDFMCLLKGLQRLLTCVDMTWNPIGPPHIRRLVNELVLEEESDEIDGRAIGHFELYLQAMREVGADTGAIRRLLDLLGSGVELRAALARCGAPKAASAFVQATFDTLETGKAHLIAAAFTWGREQATGAMFTNIVGMASQSPQMGIFTSYLKRHIELDGDSHGDLAQDMVVTLCGNDATLWSEAARGAEMALRARLDLWNAIAAEMAASDAVSMGGAPALLVC